MPNEEHPGFEYWPGNAGDFPVGDITLGSGGALGASARAEFTVPQTQPTDKTVAERYIGIPHSAQLWFALECTTDAQGNVTYEAVLRGKHLHWFAEHGETGPGPLQEVRLSAADTWRFGSTELVAGHGPHCDAMAVFWGPSPGGFGCSISVSHLEMSAATYLRLRDNPPRGVEEKIITEPPVTGPLPPMPAPPPEPEPEPGT